MSRCHDVMVSRKMMSPGRGGQDLSVGRAALLLSAASLPFVVSGVCCLPWLFLLCDGRSRGVDRRFWSDGRVYV